jgi:hypothetical protein
MAKHKHNVISSLNWLEKVSFTLMSFLPLFVVSGLLAVQTAFFPIEGESRNLYSQILFYFSAALTFFSFLSYLLLKTFVHNVGGFSGKIIEKEDATDLSLDFFITYLLPIALCQSLNLYSLIAYFIILFCVFFVVCSTDLYYENIVFIFFGFRIIKVKAKIDKIGSLEGRIVDVLLLINSTNVQDRFHCCF